MCYLKLPFIVIDSTFKENHIVKKNYVVPWYNPGHKEDEKPKNVKPK